MPEITDPTSRLLAARIRARRRELELSLTDVSTRMVADGRSFAPALLGRIENGTRAVSVPELNAIADALDVVPEYLMRAGELCASCGQEITR